MQALDDAVSPLIAREISNPAAPREVPGAVVLVAHNGVIIAEQAWGYAHLTDAAFTGPTSLLSYGARAVNSARNQAGLPAGVNSGFEGGRITDNPASMTTDTLFDMASVTKTMATTLAIMRLVDLGYVCVADTVDTHLPDFAGLPTGNVTIAQLLMHRSGILNWEAMYLFIYRDRTAVRDFIRNLPVNPTPAYWYSDLGYWVLGFIVEEVSGMCLNDFVINELYAPLGLTDTMFVPLERGISRDRIAATTWGDIHEMAMVDEVNLPGWSFPTAHLQDYLTRKDAGEFGGWRTHTLRGEVNDVNSGHAGGGISGHAGLFSTASDMAVMGQLLLNGGIYNGVRLFSEETAELFLRPVAGMGNHGLGFRFNNTFMGFPAARGGFTSFGHDGFTGTHVWFDQELNMQIIVLTNRQNIGQTIARATGAAAGQFRPGMTNVLAQGPPIAITPLVANTVVMEHFAGRANMRNSDVAVIPENAVFRVNQGYNNNQIAWNIMLTNNGTARIVDLDFVIDGNYFELVGEMPASIWPGSTVSIAVRPVAGLTARSAPYLSTLEISGSEVGPGTTAGLLFDIVFELDVELSLTVAPPPPPYTPWTPPPAADTGDDDDGDDDDGDDYYDDDYYDDADVPLDPIPRFIDVGAQHWAYSYIGFIAYRGIMQGVALDIFAPETTLNRAMAATILWRLAGEPSTEFNPIFADVRADEWYSEAIAWGSESGILLGIGNDLFNPRGELTREQFAALIFRFAQYMDVETYVSETHTLSVFADYANVSEWAIEYMRWANYAGLITGMNELILAPGGTATRAQTAAILYRFSTGILELLA